MNSTITIPAPIHRTRIVRLLLVGFALSSLIIAPARAMQAPAAPEAAPPSASQNDLPPAVDVIGDANDRARQLVQEGNRLLREGDANSALDRYRDAADLKPNTPEITFNQALGWFNLGDFGEARRLFEESLSTTNRAIVDDAAYGMGVAHHAEAEAMQQEKPKDAVQQLEQAMTRYQEVLQRNPEYEKARTSHQRAAREWRKLKELLEQQPPQQNDEPSDEENEEDQQDDNEQQQDQSPSDNQQQQDQQDQQNQDQSQQQQSDQKQEPSDQQQQEQQQQQQQEEQEQEQEQDQQSEQEQQEAAEAKEQQAQPAPPESAQREQAERELRRFMDMMRKRKQQRPQMPQENPIPIRPSDKNW